LALTGAGDVFVTSGNDEEAAFLVFGPTEPAHRLEVSKSGGGEGTVTSEPAGIDCGLACAAEYNVGEGVILTAVPKPGSVFVGWSGCNSATGQRCTVTMGASKVVEAEFEMAPGPLGAQAPAGQVAAFAARSLAPATTSPVSSSTHLAAMPSGRHKHRRHRTRTHKGERGKHR
jgi:hypothetical protein